MLKVVRQHYKNKRAKGGTSRTLSATDELLMMLEYYREYRTFKHIGIDYGVSESTAHYIVTKIEKILIENPQFHLRNLKKSIQISKSFNKALKKWKVKSEKSGRLFVIFQVSGVSSVY